MAHRFIFNLLSVFILLQAFQTSNAQNSTRPKVITQITARHPGEGKVEVIQDKSIDNLQNNYLESIARQNTISGFTLCIYSGGKQGVAKIKAGDVRSKFKGMYPDIDVSIKYEQPDWKVYAGNFRNRTDAYRLKRLIQSQFPSYIVPVQIEFSKL